ncbi:hypothetical protein BSLG_009909 [Batrachochytrium salamandrivorans]|nr:hypothetical protein BSLG_009909 [Batrachochytrium salamandrivorans]
MASKAAPGASGGSHAVSSQNTVSSASYPADSNVVPAPHCDSSDHHSSSDLADAARLPPLANDELLLWQLVTQDMTALHAQRIINDSALVRMNKVHGKIADRQEAKEGFSVKAAVKLGLIYKDAIEKAEQEQKQRAYERLTKLISQREIIEAGLESKRKKRKVDSKTGSVNSKRSRMSEVGIEPEMLPFQPGDQVVAKIEEWILANMIGYVPDKGTYEVEDAEDDDEHPGTKKRYFVAPKMLIAIPKSTGSTKEFPVKQRVLALFPSTTCFYQATVVLPPSSTLGNQYVVVFEDDNSFERNVEARMVLEWPKHM